VPQYDVVCHGRPNDAKGSLVTGPALSRMTVTGVSYLTDPALRDECGVIVAFSERGGGRSTGPYASLDLAAHVEDDAAAVDDNRCGLMAALGIEHLRSSLTMAEQVHGCAVREVTGASVGLGAFAHAGSPPPLPATDALLTLESDVPLMLCYADCVPVVLVARGAVPAVAVVHAGWRGALSRLPGRSAERLASAAGCDPSDLLAYVGPHVGACCYDVGETLLSQFVNTFGSIASAQGRLDLGAVVSESLNEVGVPISSQLDCGLCTADLTDRFFSYRAEGVTGRHGALACILKATR
jgi:polyphenol oxidase